ATARPVRGPAGACGARRAVGVPAAPRSPPRVGSERLPLTLAQRRPQALSPARRRPRGRDPERPHQAGVARQAPHVARSCTARGSATHPLPAYRPPPPPHLHSPPPPPNHPP